VIQRGKQLLGVGLRDVARGLRDPDQTEIYDGGARSDAARVGGVEAKHPTAAHDLQSGAVGPAHDEPIAARQQCYFHPFRVPSNKFGPSEEGTRECRLKFLPTMQREIETRLRAWRYNVRTSCTWLT
jgi:hypothetical protein